jgi:hypothetical protein
MPRQAGPAPRLKRRSRSRWHERCPIVRRGPREPAVIEVRPQSAALLPDPGAASDSADAAEPLTFLGRFP